MRRAPGGLRGAIIAAITFAAACAIWFSETKERTALQQLQQNQRVWADANVRSCSLDTVRFCDCSGLVEGAVGVEVTNGAVTSRTSVATGAPIPSASNALYPDVEGIFQSVRETILRNPRTMQIEYGGEYGYPETLRAAFSSRPAPTTSSWT